MDRERELDNLNLMLSKGLISQKTYDAQRAALVGAGVSMASGAIQTVRQPMPPFSILSALQFSLKPLTFLVTMAVLFITVMIGLLLSYLALSNVDVMLNIMMWNEKVFAIGSIVFMLIGKFIWAVWESAWTVFFIRPALDDLGQKIEPFSWKNFLLKSVCYACGWILFGILMLVAILGGMSLMAHFDFEHMPRNQQVIMGISFLVGGTLWALLSLYSLVPFYTALVGPFKSFVPAFIRTFKRPLFILTFVGGLILGIVVLIGFIIGIFLAWRDISEVVVKNFLDCSSVHAFFSMLIFFVVAFIGYNMVSRTGQLIIKLSFLFLIPSAIILMMLPLPLRILPMSFIFAYFPLMQFLWLFFYCLTFLGIQQVAFIAHMLTQIYCHVMGKTRTVMVENKPKTVSETVQYQPQQEDNYTPPSVFQ